MLVERISGSYYIRHSVGFCFDHWFADLLVFKDLFKIVVQKMK